MNLTLYKAYSLEDISIFTKASRTVPGFSCFLLSVHAVVCLVNTRGPNQFEFSRPSQLNWTTHASASDGFMHPELEHAYRSETHWKPLFAASDNSSFLYLGQIDLWGSTRGPDLLQVVHWTIAPKLPRHIWRQLGAFQHWHMTINGRVVPLDNHAHIADIVAEDWKGEVVEIYLTRYEEDQLHLVANRSKAFLWYNDRIRSIALKSRTTDYSVDPKEIAYFNGYFNHDWDVPAWIVIPKLDALEMLIAYFLTGTPDGILVSDFGQE